MGYSLADDYEALGDDLLPKILPNGKYNAIVKRASSGSTQGGKDKIVVTLEVTEGPHAGTEVTEQLTWSPESSTAARIMAGALATMGATPDWIRETRPSWPEIAERLLGAEVEISAKEDEWNGQARNRINFLRPLAPSPAASASTSAPQVVSLDAPQPQQPQPQPQQPQQPQQAAQSPSGGSEDNWPKL